MSSLFHRQPCRRLSTLPSEAGGGHWVSGEDAGGEDGDGVRTGCRPGSGRRGAHSTAVAAPAAASASPELHFHARDLQKHVRKIGFVHLGLQLNFCKDFYIQIFSAKTKK